MPLPVIDATSTGEAQGVEELMVLHTCSGSDRCLVVVVALETFGASAATILEVTYNGETLGFIRGQDDSGKTTQRRMGVFYHNDPTLGSNNIYVKVNRVSNLTVVAASYTGVRRWDPQTIAAGWRGNDNNPELQAPLESSTDQLVVSGLQAYNFGDFINIFADSPLVARITEENTILQSAAIGDRQGAALADTDWTLAGLATTWQLVSWTMREPEAMSTCQSVLVRSGSLVIRDGYLILCEAERDILFGDLKVTRTLRGSVSVTRAMSNDSLQEDPVQVTRSRTIDGNAQVTRLQSGNVSVTRLQTGKVRKDE